MAIGFTGLIFKVWATRFGRTVTIRFRGEYETRTLRTVREAVSRRVTLPSAWRAELYKRRVDKEQYHRYDNTPYVTGFRSRVAG